LSLGDCTPFLAGKYSNIPLEHNAEEVNLLEPSAVIFLPFSSSCSASAVCVPAGFIITPKVRWAVLQFFVVPTLSYCDRVTTQFLGCCQTAISVFVKFPMHDVVKAFVYFQLPARCME
jgi:hypothetical protein